MAPYGARGLLLALLLPVFALLGSELEGVGWIKADKLALLPVMAALEWALLGGDWEWVLGGGVVRRCPLIAGSVAGCWWRRGSLTAAPAVA